MEITQITETQADRARLKVIETALFANLTLQERCDLEDEKDEILARLGDKIRPLCEGQDDCLFCGS